MAVPIIASISPSQDIPGAEVIIHGSNLDNVTSVIFGGGATGLVLARAADRLKVQVPTAAQSGVITVTNPDGAAQTPSFTVNAPVAAPPAPRPTISKNLLWVGIAAVLVFGLFALIALVKSENSVTKDDLKSYVATTDLAPYIKTTDVETKIAAIPKPDLSIYALKTEGLDKVETANVKIALGQLYDTDGKAQFALKTDLPDLSGYVKTGDIYVADGKLAPKLDAAVRAVAKGEIKVACDEKAAERKKLAPVWEKGLQTKIDTAVTAALKAKAQANVTVVNDTAVPIASGDPKNYTIVVKPNNGEEPEKAIFPN